MDFKYYRLSLFHLIMLALQTVGLAAALWWDYRTLGLVLLGTLALTCANLMRLYRNVLENLDLMFKALTNEDYTFRLPVRSRMNNSRKYINKQFNAYSQHIRLQRQAQQEHDVFYQLIMEHIRTGVVVLDEQGRVLQANPMALQLLGVPTLRNISALNKYGEETVRAFLLAAPGTPRQLVLHIQNGQKTLWMQTTRLSTSQGIWRLVTLDDNQQALDKREAEAYNQLLHVLSHEIMNGITPIVSLSSTLIEKDHASREDCLQGLQVIHTTSGDLLHFVENCRRFMSLPQPLPTLFYVRELTTELETMQLIPPAIEWKCTVLPADLMLHADKALIRQVLINLIHNAVQAIDGKGGHIACEAYTTADDHVAIRISNDGPPIPETERTHIFVPFFTTKHKGTGLGLPICRQIMTSSHGTISLLPAGANGWSTTFLLDFN